MYNNSFKNRISDSNGRGILNNFNNSSIITERFKENKNLKVVIINGFSKNYDDLEFTNFLSNNGDIEKKELLKNILNDIINSHYSLQRHFTSDELYYSSQTTQRLLDIINRYGDDTYSDVTKIRKYKSKKDKTLQLYIIEQNNCLKIILFDTYHLGIPCEYIYKPNRQKIKFNLSKVYAKKSKNLSCISNIANQYKTD